MVLLFFLLGMSYAIRTILSVAIVAMVATDTSSNSDIPVSKKIQNKKSKLNVFGDNNWPVSKLISAFYFAFASFY